ncbi:MAG: N-formylglutamate amidohydrolase [Alphaproteobacteria bacterium]|nr:N-formylglutamate amidohydrolase [Alphaproteobacteria bacterium]
MRPQSTMHALLGPSDPAPVERYNAGGAAPVILLCDHAGRAIPQALGGLGVDAASLERHVAWDIGAAEAARHLALRFDAPLVLSAYSRLVIDCNRRLDDPTSIPVSSDDVEVPGNRDLSDAARRARGVEIFQPYHRAIEEIIEATSARGQVPAILSIHSCTPVFKGFVRPWHFGVLWNRDGRIAEPLMAGLARDPHVCVGDNQPYSARNKHGYTLDTHAESRGLPHVLVELRQDLIDTHHGAADWARRLGDALEPILADPRLYRAEKA